MKKLLPNIIYNTEFRLTSEQVEILKEAAEILIEMNSHSTNKKQKLGMIIAQIYPIAGANTRHAMVKCAVIPFYKAKRIINLIRQGPSGEIKRRKYYKKAKRTFLDYFKVVSRSKPRQYWKESDQNMTGNPSGMEDDIPF